MKDLPFDLWEAVIGVEIHIKLNTKSKLFSPAPNRFGDEPNTNITPICTGHPGTLPVINKEAVKKAVQFGLAVNAKIENVSIFERKSYFYPDLPRNFQITQYEKPIVIGGTIVADVEGVSKEYPLKRAHLEDDAGMLKHFTSFSGIDYNRAGAPLLEIVSEPVLHSPKEAVAFVMAIKSIMEYIDASDCNMEEGSLRVDVNLSVRPKGDKTLRTRIEIKNLNSFNFIEQALEYEIRHQIALYTAKPHEDITKIITPGTYRYDQEKKEVILMRRKESAEDYRYFPEPDLLPLTLSKDYINEIKKSLPELPHARYKRYVTDLKLSEYAASTLINDKKICDYFEDALKHSSNPRALCNWITVEFVGRVKDKGETLFSLGITGKSIAELVNLIENGTITGKIAKMVADDMVLHPEKSVNEIIKGNPDYLPLSDESVIEKIVVQALLENPQSVADYKAGKSKAFAFLIGQIMKLSSGKANPQSVNAILKKKLE